MIKTWIALYLAAAGIAEAAPLDLTTTPLVRGEVATLRADGAAPGEVVHFVRSAVGPGAGPCLPSGSLCVGLAAPKPLGQSAADGGGVAALTFPIPAAAPWAEVWFQALAVGSGSASNLVSAAVESPSPDQDGDGVPADADCDDTDPAVYPGAPGLCDGKTCGWNGCDALCGPACPANPSANTVLQVIGGWYLTGAEDSMLVADPDEGPAGTFEGALFYAAAGPEPGIHPMYRLVNHGSCAGTGCDHMMSLNPNEAAPDYTSEGALAWTWEAAGAGMDRLFRYYRASPYDHDAGFSSAPPVGYVQEGSLGWVYPRWGLADEDLVAVAGQEVALWANRVAGGAVWQIEWGGKRFLSEYDFGRQLQVALQLNGAGEGDNPTEAGDRWATPSDSVGWRHGSPLLSLAITGTTLSTTTHPLQWMPEGFYGGAPYDTRANPVRWDGTISKEVTLDVDGDPRVIRWTTVLDLPQDQGQVNLELATAYLTGEFTRFWTYDVPSGALVEKTGQIPSFGCVDPSEDPDQRSEAGGVAISTAGAEHALGVYRRRPLNAVEGYGLCDFLDGIGTDPHQFSTSKWNLLERPTGGLAAGRHQWTLYVVVGALDDVVDAMHDLYAAGR